MLHQKHVSTNLFWSLQRHVVLTTKETGDQPRTGGQPAGVVDLGFSGKVSEASLPSHPLASRLWYFGLSLRRVGDGDASYSIVLWPSSGFYSCIRRV